MCTFFSVVKVGVYYKISEYCSFRNDLFTEIHEIKLCLHKSCGDFEVEKQTCFQKSR